MPRPEAPSAPAEGPTPGAWIGELQSKTREELIALEHKQSTLWSEAEIGSSSCKFVYPLLLEIRPSIGKYRHHKGCLRGITRSKLIDILKGEWDFEGIVISDWGGTYSTVDAANNGLDLEMPGPARWMGEKLLEAVQNGRVSEATIDDKVRRLLRTILRAGAQEGPEVPEQAINRPEDQKLIREAAGEGIVLLKNNGVLPLDEERVKRIAVIGPNAVEAKIMGGGSARVKAHYVISPLEGIHARAGNDIEVTYALGCTNYRDIPQLKTDWLTSPGGQGSGGTISYFNTLDLEGAPVLTETLDRTQLIWFGQVAPGVDRACFSARLTGTLTVPDSGTYTLSLTSVGVSRLFIDGELLIDNWTNYKPMRGPFDRDRQAATLEVELTARRAYRLVVEYSKQQAPRFAALRIGCLPAQPADLMERAAEIAAGADVALVFIGTGEEWESEGFDRPDSEAGQGGIHIG